METVIAFLRSILRPVLSCSAHVATAKCITDSSCVAAPDDSGFHRRRHANFRSFRRFGSISQHETPLTSIRYFKTHY